MKSKTWKPGDQARRASRIRCYVLFRQGFFFLGTILLGAAITMAVDGQTFFRILFGVVLTILIFLLYWWTAKGIGISATRNGTMTYLSAQFYPDRRKDRCIKDLKGESTGGELAPPFVDMFVQDWTFDENDSVEKLDTFITNCKYALASNDAKSPSNAVSNMQWPAALALGYSSSILDKFIIWHYDDKKRHRSAGLLNKSKWLSGRLIDVIRLDDKEDKLIDDFKRTVDVHNFEDEPEEIESSMISTVVSLILTDKGKFPDDSGDVAMSGSLTAEIAQILSRVAAHVRQNPSIDYRHRVQDNCQCKDVPDMKEHRHVHVGYIRSDGCDQLAPSEFGDVALIAAAVVWLCLKKSDTLHLIARLPTPVPVAVGYLLQAASPDDKNDDLNPMEKLFPKSLHTYVRVNRKNRRWPKPE